MISRSRSSAGGMRSSGGSAAAAMPHPRTTQTKRRSAPRRAQAVTFELICGDPLKRPEVYRHVRTAAAAETRAGCFVSSMARSRAGALEIDDAPALGRVARITAPGRVPRDDEVPIERIVAPWDLRQQRPR